MSKLTKANLFRSIRWHRALGVLAWALMVVSLGAWAQADAAKRIREELVLVQQEQQAVFQQFQMVREMRNGLAAPLVAPPPLTVYGSGQSLNYDDQVAAQKEREQKLIDYGQEMERLFARYQELDARRKTLVEELGTVSGNR